jgi:hypothetical protein
MAWVEVECMDTTTDPITIRLLANWYIRPPQGPAAGQMGAYGGYDQSMMQQGARGPGNFGPRGGRGGRRW